MTLVSAALWAAGRPHTCAAAPAPSAHLRGAGHCLCSRLALLASKFGGVCRPVLGSRRGLCCRCGGGERGPIHPAQRIQFASQLVSAGLRAGAPVSRVRNQATCQGARSAAPHLDWHPGAVEALREQHAPAAEAMVGSSKLELQPGAGT